VDRPLPHPYWNANRGGKGDAEQFKADQRSKKHRAWVNAQLEVAQARRDWAHKQEVRKFYADKRKKAKKGRAV